MFSSMMRMESLNPIQKREFCKKSSRFTLKAVPILIFRVHLKRSNLIPLKTVIERRFNLILRQKASFGKRPPNSIGSLPSNSKTWNIGAKKEKDPVADHSARILEIVKGILNQVAILSLRHRNSMFIPFWEALQHYELFWAINETTLKEWWMI